MNIHGKDIKIFSCNANKQFAEQIARTLGLPVGDTGRALPCGSCARWTAD